MAYILGCFNRPWFDFDYQDALAGMADAGFKYTGLMRQAGDYVLDSATSEEDCAAIKQMVESAGLHMNTVLGNIDLTDGIDGGVTKLEALLENIAAVGASYLLNCGTNDESLRADYYTVLREGAQIGEDLGVTVTLKPHGGITMHGADLMQAVETIDHNNFGVYYDPGNIVHYGGYDPVEEARIVADHVVAMCVKDSEGQQVGVNILPSEGVVDFQGVMEALATGGFTDGPLLIECLGGDTLDEVNARAEKTRGFLQQFNG